VVSLLVLNVSMVCPVSFGLVDTTSELEIPSDDISSLPVEILIDRLVVFHCHCSSETGCVCLGVVTVVRLCGDASTRWSPSVAVYFPLSLFKIFDFEQAVSDLHLFLLYDSSWQAWLLLIAAFVLLVVGGTNRISSIPPQLQLASPPLVVHDI
jgi:hypothetical protein